MIFCSSHSLFKQEACFPHSACCLCYILSEVGVFAASKFVLASSRWIPLFTGADYNFSHGHKHDKKKRHGVITSCKNWFAFLIRSLRSKQKDMHYPIIPTKCDGAQRSIISKTLIPESLILHEKLWVRGLCEGMCAAGRKICHERVTTLKTESATQNFLKPKQKMWRVNEKKEIAAICENVNTC